MHRHVNPAFCVLVLLGAARVRAESSTRADAPATVMNADELADRIRGGLVGQLIGNLNGLPHEFKYIDEPGALERYVPSLPEGARTDDDTDLEWVFVREIASSGRSLAPPERIVELWRRHINRSIWCANRYARDLMELGIAPPLTGASALNPWSDFNISGQFACESYGLMAPAMPQTAARIALNYTRATVDGEPLQTTQLFAAMIAAAFIEKDLERLLDIGLASVDPESRVAEIVGEVRRIHRDEPDDWRAARRRIKDRWQVRDGSFRDQNGYELNTACTVAALLYGAGDFVDTLQLAFNLGWDCDNNAATAATILGVINGRRWINDQGWDIKDVYANTTRDGMPVDETITGFENSLIKCGQLVIQEQGGELTTDDGRPAWRIRAERPANVEPLAGGRQDPAISRAQLLEHMEQDLAGQPVDRARAAYVAICLGQADRLAAERPVPWEQALTALRGYPNVVRNIHEALKDSPSAARIQRNARKAGLEPPPTAQ